MAKSCGIIYGVADSEGIKRLRQLAARRGKLNVEIDEVTEEVLRAGEFVGDVADALGVTRETVRRFRDAHGIPDAREIRKAKGSAFRREG